MSENTDHVRAMIPPPLFFLGYLIGALIMNWIVPFPTPWGLTLRSIGGLIIIAGIFLIASAFSQMRNFHTTPDINKPTMALVTAGPYRFTRNPMYLGFFLIYLGFTLLAGTLWGFLIGPFLVWTITQAIIHTEEEYLLIKFKVDYIRYTSHVRRWI
jgi:protein-S-isoprenylcysteine O-methyltransferase Ste14